VVEPDDIAHGGRPAVAPRFCLLDASDAVLAARLRGRVATPEAAADLRRVSGQTLDEYLDAVTRHAAVLRAPFAERPDTAVIDTSFLGPEQVADAIRSWLQVSRG
jgi:hypothetical protein